MDNTHVGGRQVYLIFFQCAKQNKEAESGHMCACLFWGYFLIERQTRRGRQETFWGVPLADTPLAVARHPVP